MIFPEFKINCDIVYSNHKFQEKKRSNHNNNNNNNNSDRSSNAVVLQWVPEEEEDNDDDDDDVWVIWLPLWIKYSESEPGWSVRIRLKTQFSHKTIM